MQVSDQGKAVAAILALTALAVALFFLTGGCSRNSGGGGSSSARDPVVEKIDHLIDRNR